MENHVQASFDTDLRGNFRRGDGNADSSSRGAADHSGGSRAAAAKRRGSEFGTWHYTRPQNSSARGGGRRANFADAFSGQVSDFRRVEYRPRCIEGHLSQIAGRGSDTTHQAFRTAHRDRYAGCAIAAWRSSAADRYQGFGWPCVEHKFPAEDSALAPMRCPFCNAEKDDLAPVCATCGRDTAIPESLITERAELLTKRDRLRSELAEANARLAARRRRKPA